jgi:hypothetical protein
VPRSGIESSVDRRDLFPLWHVRTCARLAKNLPSVRSKPRLNLGGTKETKLCLADLVGLDSVCDAEAELAELDSQGLAGDSQQPSGLVLIASDEFQNSGKQDPVHMHGCV